MRKENPMTKSKKTISSFVNNQFDFILFLIIIILLSLGIVMVLSASAPSAIAESGNSYSYVKTQLLAAVIGIGLMNRYFQNRTIEHIKIFIKYFM